MISKYLMKILKYLVLGLAKDSTYERFRNNNKTERRKMQIWYSLHKNI